MLLEPDPVVLVQPPRHAVAQAGRRPRRIDRIITEREDDLNRCSRCIGRDAPERLLQKPPIVLGAPRSASGMARLTPTPPAGDIACAASPMHRSARPVPRLQAVDFDGQ